MKGNGLNLLFTELYKFLGNQNMRTSNLHLNLLQSAVTDSPFL